ncbi:hypothetical protein FJR48_01630 [Sulfurimonas lithotrophica]|uniref:Uncharacterized protein n=1 Tax=Sulfurimonas lithotrophica TaxID=2590022 RepID=A0A5P8NYM0_9BACT|nr:hypothetical protein [Sulfurimonas lithotrophica]QFR48494.1 hypothetical protein FJR48_01630 [Sulfurimonas lithotrophica]
MELFFELEIAYIVIGLFILAVTAFVTTRDFVPRVAFKRGMILVSGFLIIMIGSHFYITTKRMAGVKEIFNNGETVICENKMQRTISRSVLISKELEWRLEGDEFVSDNHTRSFHTSRCIEHILDDVPEVTK